MAAKHEVEAKFTLKDEMSVQLEAIRKRANALEKDAAQLTGTTGKVQGSFTELTKGLDRFAPGMGRAVSTVTDMTMGLSPLALGLGLAAGAVTVLGGAVAVGVKELVAMGDRLMNLSRATGITTDALQRMEAFGRPIGISLDQMASASTRLEKSLGEGGKGVAEALRKLGLSMADVAAMDADTRLLAVAKALANLKSPLDQAEAGSALLGRAWADLRLDAASIAEGTAAIENTIIVSDGALDAGEALGDSWDRLAANAKALAAEGGEPIAEMLTTWIKLLDEAVLGWDLLFKQLAKPVNIPKDSPAAQFGFDSSLTTEGFKSNADIARGGVSGEELARQQAAQASIKKQVEDEENAEKKRLAILELGAEEREKAEKEMASFLEKINKQTLDQLLGDAKDYWADLKQIQTENRDILAMFVPDPIAMKEALDEALVTLGSGLGGVDTLSTRGRFAGQSLSGLVPGVDSSSFGGATENLDQFGLSLESAADIAQVFGDDLGEFGEALLQGVAAGELLERAFLKQADGSKKLDTTFQGLTNTAIGVAAGISALVGATSSGSQGSRAGKGALAGASAGAAFGPIGMGVGAAAGAIVGWLRGRGPAQIGEDAGRDMGASLSQALMEEIYKSGENAQMFLREIFAEGDLGIDRFAEEVGDLFSFFERGEISESSLLGELEETLPILIENFDELGPVGEENLERIIAAAKEMGIDLGAAGDQLDRLQKGIPELTLEGFTSQFDLNEEQQAKLQSLGLGIQTDEERVADELNVPLELLKELAPALEEIGISLTELPDFMESLPGIEDLGDLATTLQLPPELIAQFDALKPPDPKTVAEANGLAVANHLGPALDALGDKIIRGIRDAVAQST